MKKNIGVIITLAVSLVLVRFVQARDDKYLLPIQAALEAKDFLGRPDGSVKFFFSKQPTPPIIGRFGNHTTYGRTTKLRNSDEVVCQASFLAALLALQKWPKQVGANAVVNIVSFLPES
jgi:hypothetical protein